MRDSPLSTGLLIPIARTWNWEGIPVRWVPGEAWAFIDGAWKRVHSTEVGMNAAEVTEETFNETFSDLRLIALPAIAFQP
jgi:hypothetical protein